MEEGNDDHNTRFPDGGHLHPIEQDCKGTVLITDESPALGNVTPFPFMRLPPEVRTMIYKEHLIQPSAIVGRNSGRYSAYLGGGPPEDWNGWDASRRISQASVVNLFQVSKDILNESLELYFHYNSFYFDYSNLVETFLRKIGARSRHAITSIQMRLDGDKPATAAKSLSLCPNLERLDLTISGSVRILDGRCRFPYDAMKICGLNHLLKLRGIKDLTIKFLCPSHTTDQLFRNWDSLVRALQVIKKPRSKAQADRRLRKKALDLSQTPRKASKHRRGRVGKRELELLV